MALVVVCPRVSTKVVLVVYIRRKLEVLVNKVGGYTSLCQTRYGDLSLLELGAQRSEKTTSLRGRVTGAAVRFPDVAITAPVGNELASEDVLDTL